MQIFILKSHKFQNIQNPKQWTYRQVVPPISMSSIYEFEEPNGPVVPGLVDLDSENFKISKLSSADSCTDATTIRLVPVWNSAWQA